MATTLGQPVRIPLSVTDPSTSLPTDATVSVVVTKPDGSTITPSITHPATGEYETIVVPNLAGTWLYVWSVTGAVTGVDDGQFEVTAVQIRINSLADLKAHLNKKQDADDIELQDVADAAQAMIEREIGAVVPRNYSERYNGGRHRISVANGPILSVTSVVEHLHGTVSKILTSQEYRVGTQHIDRLTTTGAHWFFQGFSDDVLITYVAGRSQPVAANIRLAHKELTAHLWRNSQIGRTRRTRGQMPEDDMAQASPGFSMPNRVREMIGVKRPMVF
jgi:hypothetical protein